MTNGKGSSRAEIERIQTITKTRTNLLSIQNSLRSTLPDTLDASLLLTRIKNAMGVRDIIGTGLGFLFAGLFFIFILAVYGQFGTLASLWPASNVTKITTNIANSVVTASAFLTLILLIEAIGFIALILGLVEALVS